MNLHATITSRVQATGGCDPDTLHGLLLITEQGAPPGRISALLNCRDLDDLLDKAREGLVGRVGTIGEDGEEPEVMDFPGGLFARRWKRALIAGLLVGISSDSYEELPSGLDIGIALSSLRSELKSFGVGVAVLQDKRTGRCTFRIIGRDAYRMQKIIANGWAL